MGDHREQLVDVGTAVAESGVRAAQVLGWLRDSGWSRADRRAGDDLVHELFATDFAETDRAGARFRERFPGVEDDTVVTVLTSGGAAGTWDAREGTGPPDCPRCGARYAAGFADLSWIEGWRESGTEPVLACAECGHVGPVGDWDLEASIAVGPVGVVVDARGSAAFPRDVALALREELRRAVGGRWAYVHLHD